MVLLGGCRCCPAQVYGVVWVVVSVAFMVGRRVGRHLLLQVINACACACGGIYYEVEVEVEVVLLILVEVVLLLLVDSGFIH